MEKWVVTYDKKTDVVASRSDPAFATKRIGYLLRTLYCMIRLLPAFYVNSSSQLNYRVTYKSSTRIDTNPQQAIMLDTTYKQNTLSYAFPTIPLIAGNIQIGVTYMDPNTLQVRM